MSATELGERLTEVRRLRGGSLRDVAEKAGISAAYLQKLERGQVQGPSPNVLYALARALNTQYSGLMRMAGYVVPRGSVERTGSGSMLTHALSSEELTEEEAREVAKYLAWFRSQQRTERAP